MIRGQRFLICGVALALALATAVSQVALPSSGRSPKEVVGELWSMATAGELLNNDGWHKAAGFFNHPAPPPGKKTVNVVSNFWGPPAQRILNDNKAEVIVGFEDLGQIDDELNYTPPRGPAAFKSGMLYHLVFAQTHWTMYKADGKTVDREMPGPMEWQIEDAQGLPFATVNTAIRYVLEARDAARDPIVRKTADQTLTKLRTLH